MAEAPPQNTEGRGSLPSGNEPFPVRPLSSGAPLRRSPKLSNLSVGSINATQNDNPMTPPIIMNVQDPEENQEFQEVAVSPNPGRLSQVEGNTPDIATANLDSLLPPPEEFTGQDTSLSENGPISTLDGARHSIGSQRNTELYTSLKDSNVITETPAGGQFPVSGSRESNNPPGVVKSPGIIKQPVGEIPGLTTVELGAGAADAVAITLDVPVSATRAQPVPLPIEMISSSVTPENRKPRSAKKGKVIAGGDFGGRTLTASSSYTYPSYQNSFVKPKKGKDPTKFQPQPTEPQYQYHNQNQNYNYQQEPPNQNDQLPSVVKGMGAISFKVPGRITHKTTIKIAHYPQAGNEIISVEQPVPMPCGPNMDCMGMDEYPPEDDYGAGNCGGQYPNGNYTNNCNFATYNVSDGHQNQMDPNAMMQMQMMQQHQGYGNPYGGNGGYYPYGYPPY